MIVNKKISIIRLNLVDNQLAFIRNCKWLENTCKSFCNIQETKSLLNILFICCIFVTCKMQEGDDLWDDINKVKALVDSNACLEVCVRDEDIVMTLLESLPTLYKNLITALGIMPRNELTRKYMMACLIHVISKMNETESQDNDATMMLREGK